MTDKKQDAGAVERIVAEMRASATAMRCQAGDSTNVLHVTARKNAETVKAWADEIASGHAALLAERDALREEKRLAEMFQQFVIGEGAWERFHALTTRAEAAEQLAAELRQRAEAAEGRLHCLADHLCGDGPSPAMADAMINGSDVQLFAAIDAAIAHEAEGKA